MLRCLCYNCTNRDGKTRMRLFTSELSPSPLDLLQLHHLLLAPLLLHILGLVPPPSRSPLLSLLLNDVICGFWAADLPRVWLTLQNQNFLLSAVLHLSWKDCRDEGWTHQDAPEAAACALAGGSGGVGGAAPPHRSTTCCRNQGDGGGTTFKDPGATACPPTVLQLLHLRSR